MALSQQELESLLKEAFVDGKVIITDLAGDGDHYAAEIESAQFIGKTKVQQHQMVYAAMKGKMGGQLHALQLTTKIPENIK